MRRPGAVALVLAAVAPVGAAEGSLEVWSIPGAGFAKIFSLDDELVTESSRPPALVGFVEPLQPVDAEEDLALLSERIVAETRVHSDFAGHKGAASRGAGLGAGSGKGGTQLTFADANAANARAAGAAISQSTANSVRTQSVRGTAAVAAKQPLNARSWFGWMRFSLSFAFVVKSLCMMCNIFYQASPLPLINEFNMKGDTGGADLAPFIALAYGGWQWCFYGLFAYIVTSKSGFLVLVYSNVVGATLGLYYVYAFTRNCRNAAMLQRSSKYYYVLGCIVAVQMCAIISVQPVRALFFCGLISSSWSTIASLSLISTVPEIYATRSSKSLPVPLLVMGEISAILWIVCGVMLWDPWIGFPNCFAACVCTFALYLCWKFPADGAACDGLLCNDDIAAAVAAKEAELDDASCEYSAEKASPTPLQRALGYVSRTAPLPEREPLHDPMAASRVYGGTGGTGDW